MLGVFSDIIQRAYITQLKLISIDNSAFKLHYRLTFWLLLGCTILVCSRQYIGEHIRCIVDNGVPQHVVNTFCFFTTTYTVIQQTNYTFAHPGVGPHTHNERIVQHAYYQWVPFVLFGQALLFYLPHLIWRIYEGGTIRNMVEGLQRIYLKSPDDNDVRVNNYLIYSEKTETRLIKEVHKHFQTISRFRINRNWARMLVVCEFLNFLNVVIQLRTMDNFLGGSFFSLGRQMFYAGPGEDPFDRVFPKITKCDFYKYGPTGSIQNQDAMCVMALNIVNEKIYACLWFWFAFLIPVSIAALAWRVISYTFYSSEKFNHYVLRETIGTKSNPVDVAIIARQPCFSDWLLLHYLAKNMDSRLFTELIRSLASELDDPRHSPDFEDEKRPLKAA